jgi:hypothetical protein
MAARMSGEVGKSEILTTASSLLAPFAAKIPTFPDAAQLKLVPCSKWKWLNDCNRRFSFIWRLTALGRKLKTLEDPLRKWQFPIYLLQTERFWQLTKGTMLILMCW